MTNSMKNYQFPILILLLFYSISAQAAQTCNPNFAAAAQSALNQINAICGSIAKLSSSNCQRALVENCKKQKNSSSDIKTEICGQIASDTQGINSQNFAGAATGQNTTQEANAMLNNDATASSNTLSTLLTMRSGTIKQMMQTNLDLMQDPGCLKSSAAKAYLAAVQDLNNNLNKFKSAMDTLKTEKQTEAQISSTASEKSIQNANNLKSNMPMASDKKDSSTISPLAIGAGAAALGGAALLFSKLRTDQGNDVELPSPKGAKPEAFDGNVDELFTKYGIQVDPSFKDAEKSAIAKAVTYIPECLRARLKGIRVVNNPDLKWKSKTAAKNPGDCLMGKELGPTLVQINPTCTPSNPIPMALVIHEFVHKLANDNGGQLYTQYASSFHRYPGCGVSAYSQDYYQGKNLNEDFAEAGRLALAPGGDFGQRAGECVNAKIHVARTLLACEK